jgi:hypothetical protein
MSADKASASTTPTTKGATLLALRLVKGIRSAHSDDLIEAASRVCEWIAGAFGAFVFVGVVEEVALPAFGYDAIWNWPGALVALGVGGELWFAFRATYLQRELSRRSNKALAKVTRTASKANSRAEKALKRLAKTQEGLAAAVKEAAELRRKYAWRGITTDQADALHALLKASPGRIAIEYMNGDPESSHFATLIGLAFRDAGWRAIMMPGSYLFFPSFGFVLPSKGEGADEHTPLIASAVSMLDKEIAFRRLPRAFMVTQEELTPIAAGVESGAASRLFVGPKHQYSEPPAATAKSKTGPKSKS